MSELVDRAKAREPQAWAEIYERFSGPIFGFLFMRLGNRDAAEDLTADVFMEGLEGVGRFKGELDGLRAWLFQIAKNNLVDYQRKGGRVRSVPLDEIASGPPVAPEGDPADAAILNLAKRRMMEAIDGLSPDQREILLLRISGGLTSKEIADLVGKSHGAVRAIQHRAVIALQASMSKRLPRRGKRR